MHETTCRVVIILHVPLGEEKGTKKLEWSQCFHLLTLERWGFTQVCVTPILITRNNLLSVVGNKWNANGFAQQNMYSRYRYLSLLDSHNLVVLVEHYFIIFFISHNLVVFVEHYFIIFCSI
jgi:hypothetical protein